MCRDLANTGTFTPRLRRGGSYYGIAFNLESVDCGALTLRTGLRGADTEPGEPALLCPAHVHSIGLYACRGPIGRNARDRLGRWCRAPDFECLECSGRIAARTAANEPDDCPSQLGRDLADASLMEQVNSRYYRLRHTLSCCPPHPRTIKYDSESIGHGRNISRRRVGRIWNGSWKASATEDPLADLLRLRAWRGGRKRMLHHRADAARSQLPVAEAPRQRPPA